jgi:LPS-assembly lipoprotein
MAGILAVALAGCFQPMYAETPLLGGTSLRDALREVEIVAIEGRVGQAIRNDLIFELAGAEGNPVGAPYRLNMVVTTGTVNPVADTITGVPPADIVILNVNYQLLDVANNQVLLADSALARVTLDRSMQRFARFRALRDAENRAAKTVAQQVRSRLASFFLTRA